MTKLYPVMWNILRNSNNILNRQYDKPISFSYENYNVHMEIKNNMCPFTKYYIKLDSENNSFEVIIERVSKSKLALRAGYMDELVITSDLLRDYYRDVIRGDD